MEKHLIIFNFLFLFLFISLFFIDSFRLNFLRIYSFCYSMLFLFFSIFLFFFNKIDSFFYIGSLSFVFDSISLSFIVLSTMLVPVCIVCSWESILYRLKDYLLLLFFIEFLLVNAFFTTNLLLFFIFFESILIPMFIIIGIWGSRERKIKAAYEFFIYTFCGSLLFLLSLIYIYISKGSFELPTLGKLSFSVTEEYFLWLALFIAFAVKIPIIPFHLWLPEAHVEAPTGGSVLLAGILLKLGGYGFIRFLIYLFPLGSTYFSPFVMTLGVIGIIYSSYSTLGQIDLKKIIAYSSIAHMNYVVIGIFSFTIEALEGSLFLMLSHGAISSGLFLCIGFLYDRFGSRLLFDYSGLARIMPLFSIFFFFLTIANLGLPGTSSFIGEFLVIIGVFGVNKIVAFICCLGVIFSASYSIWLFNRLCFSNSSSPFIGIYDLNKRELFLLTYVSSFILWLGVYSTWYFNFIENALNLILIRVI